MPPRLLGRARLVRTWCRPLADASNQGTVGLLGQTTAKMKPGPMLPVRVVLLHGEGWQEGVSREEVAPPASTKKGCSYSACRTSWLCFSGVLRTRKPSCPEYLTSDKYRRLPTLSKTRVNISETSAN